MSVTNQEVAARLREIYKLMQLAGENRFRAIAFDRAAQAVESLNEDINEYIENGSLTEIKGVGSSIAEDIKSYAETGTIDVLANLRDRIPGDIVKWLKISGLGPKGIHKIHQELGISKLEELKEACKDGRVASLPGMGEVSAQKILTSIKWMEQFEERCRLDEAIKVAQPFYDFLKDQEGVQQIEVAGSLRRSLETIGDIDLLIGAEEKYASDLFDLFVNHELVVDVLGRGDTKSSIRTIDGRQVDLRIVNPQQFPAALIYFTGSKEHNVRLRQRARERGLSLNEYGLFDLDEEGNTDFNKPKEFASEQDIYQKLDLFFVPPELREDRGEIKYFAEHPQMDLVEEQQIRGVLHVHSTWSDGRYSIRAMAEACIERGYEYLGITDHSQTAAYAGGLTPEQVLEQLDEIDRLNEEFAEQNFRIFKGIESDILPDGSLDYEEAILERFDFVIASIHSGLEMPKDKMTERLYKAVENPYTRILGHPTGRLLLRRNGSDVELNEIIELAAEHNTAIEINANPHRLELDWRYGDKAFSVELMTSINPDAHSIVDLDYMPYGVRIARKGKFSKGQVLNTKTTDELAEWFQNKEI